MTELLTAIPFAIDDAWRAEKLCDWIYQLNGRKSQGRCLLVPARDVHAELRKKVSIAAELAFESTDMVAVDSRITASRAEQSNHLLRQTALLVYNGYRLPFLWLEPDCVPLRKGWMRELSDAYEKSVKRFLGPHLSVPDKECDTPMRMLARVSIYPQDALRDIDGPCRETVPFERVAAAALVQRSEKTRLIQHLLFTDDTAISAIRADACLLHSDKTGKLIDELRKGGKPSQTRKEPVIA